MTGTVNPPPGAFNPRLPRARGDRTPDDFSFVTATGSSSARTLADWMAIVENGAFQWPVSVVVADSGLTPYAQRDDLIVEGTGDTGLTVMTNGGRAGIDLIGDDGVVTGSNIHFWDAGNPGTRGQKLAANNSLHPSAPNAVYMRSTPDNGAHNHESMRWFWDASTADNDDGNSSALGNFGVGVSTDIWSATSASHVLTIATGTAPTAATGYVHVYSLAGELRVLDQTGQGSQLTGDPRFTKIDNGATGCQLDLNHFSSSPALNDFNGIIRFRGRDSGANELSYVETRSRIIDPTDASEDGRYEIATTIAGTLADRVYVGGGLFTSGATGGDKGTGTINATAVYDDDSLLTCMAMADEFIERGEVDLEKWDALVPDIEQPAQVFKRKKIVEVESTATRYEMTDEGMVARKVVVKESVPATEAYPVWDEDGNGVGIVEQPVIEEVTVPARTIKRTHRTARVFKAMIDSGFDPRDPAKYFAKMRQDEALPGMPTQADWNHNGLSVGGLASRQWLAMEMLAIVCNVMWGRLQEHSRRLAALESN